MNESKSTNRRSVLKTIGTGVVGGATLSGTATARGNLVSKINRDGHWAWFPLKQETDWGRQKHPYDFQEGDSRWMAEPASGGAVRMLAKNITTPDTFPNRNTGFDIHMGPIGELDSIQFTSRTVQTQDGKARLFVGLYLDENKNGEFFKWEKKRGDRERAVPGQFGDEEGLLFTDADGSFTIGDDTPFFLIKRREVATLGHLKKGEIGPCCPDDDGKKSEGIDAETPSALYLGVVDPSPENGNVEEAVVERVNIRRK